jgi:hypothetical protein
MTLLYFIHEDASLNNYALTAVILVF